MVPGVGCPTLETVASISRDDMVAFHREYFHPDNIIMGVSGDFERDEIIKKLETLLESWEPRALSLPDLKLPPDQGRKKCLLRP